MVFRRATYITWGIGRGEPRKSRLFWAKMALALLVAISGPNFIERTPVTVEVKQQKERQQWWKHLEEKMSTRAGPQQHES
jgi:hypothetical protein